jgi:glycosyltransferase involved in cell wall biosynthesis
MEASGQPQIVLVHDWLTGMRGGERCLEVLCRRWPEAPLFTLLHKRGTVSPVIEKRALHTSLLARFPGVNRYYRYLLPLMPAATRYWRLPHCDLVVSLSHCVAKGARPPDGVPHVCYCFTPMRYAWHQRRAYFGREQLGRLKEKIVDRLLETLRRWDRRTAGNVSHFVAISRTVEERIRECYGRASQVIYPPVDTDFYSPAAGRREDFYLIVSAFAPYKRLDVGIAACNRLGRKLVIIGSGQDEKRLRRMAGPAVHFLGWQQDTVVRDYLRRARALIFPGEEDFGIVPVEAMASGTPVIAFGRGGATETVIPLNGRSQAETLAAAEPTGIWFQEHSADCLAEAIRLYERRAGELDPAAARRQALCFSKRRFEEEFFGYIDGVLGADRAEQRRAA